MADESADSFKDFFQAIFPTFKFYENLFPHHLPLVTQFFLGAISSFWSFDLYELQKLFIFYFLGPNYRDIRIWH